MTELSSGAQAVLTAFNKRDDRIDLFDDSTSTLVKFQKAHVYGLAAALRTVAQFVRMDHPLGDTDADAGVFTAHQFIHGYIVAMADELEAQP